MSTKFYGLYQYQPETLKALERYLSGPKSRKKNLTNFILNILYKSYKKTKRSENRDFTVTPTLNSASPSSEKCPEETSWSSFVPIRRNNLDFLYKLIDSDVEVVSFDIFDTLLERPLLEPTDLFHLIGNKYDKDTKKSFYEVRKKYDDGLKNFDEIYSAIEKGENIPSSVIQQMKLDELQLETSLLRRREEIFQVYNYAVKRGKKVIAISDMYLPDSFLTDVLKRNGYMNIAKVYVSSAHNKRKDKGSLYDYVLEKEGLPPKKLLHVGDNKLSDWDIPLSKGIKAFHLRSLKEIVLNSESFLKNIYNFKDPSDRLIFGYLLCENQQLYLKSSTGQYVHKAGDIGSLVLGPILLYITLWLLNDIEIRSAYKKILFAGRDGYLVEKAYNLAASFLGKEGSVETSYLLGGRCLQCKLEDDPLRYCANSGVIDENVTILQLVSSLIDDEDILNKIDSSYDSSELNLKIHDPQSYEILENCKKIAAPYFKQQRQNLMNFYKGYIDQNKTAIFDTGYSGSVSDFLFKATGRKIDKLYLWESNSNIENDLRNNTKTHCLFGSLESFVSRSFLPLVLEEIFSPLVGSAKSVNSQGIVNYDHFEIPPNMERDLSEIQSEMLKLVHSFSKLYGKWISCISPSNPHTAFNLAFAFFEESPYPQTTWLKSIKFNDIFLSRQQSLAYKIERGPRISASNDKCVGMFSPSKVIQLLPSSDSRRINNKIGLFWYPKDIESFYKLLPEISKFPSGTFLTIMAQDENQRSVYEEMLLTCLPRMISKVIKSPDLLDTPLMSWLRYSEKLNASCDVVFFLTDSETNYYEESAPDEQRTFLEKRFFRDMLATLLARENLGILSPYLSPSKASSKILSALKEKPIILEPIFNFIFGADWELTRGDWVIPNKQLFCYRPVIFNVASLTISNFIQEKNLPPSESLDTSILLLLAYMGHQNGLDIHFFDLDTVSYQNS